MTKHSEGFHMVPLGQMKTQVPMAPSWAGPLKRYLAFQVSSGRPQSTIYLYGYHLRRFAYQTGLDPFRVDLFHLVDYLAAEPSWSAGTRKSHRTSLRAFYKWAHVTGQMTTNVAGSLPTISVRPGIPRPAPESAVKLGLETLETRVRLMVRLGAGNGLRCCEIALVHTDDLFEDLTGWSLLLHGKGGKKRLAPLSDSLARTLRQLPPGWVFPGRVDGHISASYVSKLVSQALPEKVTAHRLRHRFASVSYAQGGRDILAVRDLLGHASVATTQIYTAVPDDSLRRAALAAS